MNKLITICVLACTASFGAGCFLNLIFTPRSGGSAHVALAVYPRESELTLEDLKMINSKLDEWRTSHIKSLRVDSCLAAIPLGPMELEIRFANLTTAQSDSVCSMVRELLVAINDTRQAEH